uniref:Right handed beta helix domain-containing protein n=1 Tax=Amphimedon queenslandica TaxID=400682 RepID=A0A1X7UE90_AMPQE
MRCLEIGLLLPFIVIIQCHFFYADVDQKVFYVYPNGEPSKCPSGNNNCSTLEDYVSSGAFENLSNNSVFHFIPGIHSLNSSIIIIQPSIDITFEGLREMGQGPHQTAMESPAIIQCTENVTLFVRCNHIQLSKVTLKNCGDKYATIDLSSAITISDSYNVTMTYVSIQESPLGGLTLNLVVHCQIYNSSFYSNNHDTPDNRTMTITALYINPLSPLYTSNWSFVMSKSNITNNRFNGLSIVNRQSEYFIGIQLEMVYAANNSVINFGIFPYSDYFDLNVNGLVSTGSLVGFILHKKEQVLSKRKPNILMTNCSITYNKFYGMKVVWHGSGSCSFCLKSSNFSHNAGILGSALEITTDQFVNTQSGIDVILHKVTFDNNTIYNLYAKNATISPAFAMTVKISNVNSVSINNCTFSSNKGSGLGLINTYVTFNGDVYFINNTAYNGGGIYMISSSVLFLSLGSLLKFVGNHANNSGGAINVEQIVLTVDLNSNSGQVSNRCFFQLPDNYVDQVNTYFHFEDNTASVAGSVLYGGTTRQCLQGPEKVLPDQFNRISKFYNQPGLSVISSGPRGMCFCTNNLPDCSLKSISMSAIPGEIIEFAVAVVGQDYNTTTGIIIISSDSGELSNQNVSSAVCANLTHEVTANNNETNRIKVSISIHFETNFFQPPLIIDVNVLPCLPGTYLSQQSHVCECDNSIKNATISCNGTGAVVIKEGNSWIGPNYNNCTNIVYQFCPYDYCIQSQVTFPLNESDRQCALNRSGLLCGRCSEGLSLMLGSNNCGECTNDYLSLIIPFSLAGVVLVILLLVLNLTVTVGTINGLLFFANVIKINQPLFYGTDSVPVLSQFISWINLDLGIKTCFFAGMTTCTKTALQFVFPFYLWFLILLIIFLSRRFSKLSQLIGKNSVPVLCTLLLLSYTKLLRTIISIFIVANPSSTCTGFVWYNSGEPYFTGCHLVLFIIAIAALLLFLPYTLFLLLFPLWEICRSKWNFGTSFYLKLKPFFDAYAGPYTDMFRIWPGLLLVARIVLAVLIVVSPTYDEPIGLLVTITALLIVTLSFGSVYKNKKLHSLDILYLLCLLAIFFCLFGALIQNGGESNRLPSFTNRNKARIGIGAIFSIAFIGFLGILAYHVYICFNCRAIGRKGSHTIQVEEVASDKYSHLNTAPTASEFPALIRPECREPLLESADNN